MLAKGDIKNIVDPRLQGDFDTNSVWRAVEVAMACVSQSSAKRPTMNQVVIDLNESLAIEIARTNVGHETESRSISLNLHSELLPLARAMYEGFRKDQQRTKEGRRDGFKDNRSFVDIVSKNQKSRNEAWVEVATNNQRAPTVATKDSNVNSWKMDIDRNMSDYKWLGRLTGFETEATIFEETSSSEGTERPCGKHSKGRTYSSDDRGSMSNDKMDNRSFGNWDGKDKRKAVREVSSGRKNGSFSKSKSKGENFVCDRTKTKGKELAVRRLKVRYTPFQYLNGKLVLEKRKGATCNDVIAGTGSSDSDSSSEEGEVGDRATFRGECSNLKSVGLKPVSEPVVSNSEDELVMDPIILKAHSGLNNIMISSKDCEAFSNPSEGPSLVVRNNNRQLMSFSDQEGRTLSLPLRGPISLPL
ncbi:hypothetical protein EZV62_028313 [Acer yangbiense]|uniref:Serine-threonine/tyrosine-protein kinase catalytic domain-containing protein n=1 Tax=Acer yangbiense TaxID=1000413 RepID=A0A5C7GNP8_9ROSI|nr:hypothetical protein EZV62_028313 [Acer yangbiense]